MSPPDPRVELIERRIVFDGHFKIVRYRLRHELFQGGMGKELVHEVFERGHAVAVLPYEPARDQVVLVEQFRIGALEVPGDPWLLEPVAGIIDEGETPVEVARREALEEAGLELQDLISRLHVLRQPGRHDRDLPGAHRPGRGPFGRRRPWPGGRGGGHLSPPLAVGRGAGRHR